MKPNLLKVGQENGNYLLFNKRGMVLELTADEYQLFQRHADDTHFPAEGQEFFNRLCFYGMLEFTGYQPTKVPLPYSMKLRDHDSAEPLFQAPIVAHLGITRKCNLSCSYCSVRPYYQEAEELSTENWKTIIGKLADWGVFQIGFTGGEPTLRKDLPELGRYVTGLNCAFNLTTNGWHLREGLVAELKDAGMRQGQVSLDCHLAEIHDQLRGKNSHGRAVQAIKLLQQHDIVVGIDCVVSRVNLPHLPAFVDWLTQEQVPYLTLIKIKPGDLSLDAFQELLPTYEQYSQFLEELCERDNVNPCVTVDCGSVSNLQYTLREDELSKVPVAGCPAGHTLLSISPDGEIYPCVALASKEFRLGNALDDDLPELWSRNETLRALREVKNRVQGQCQHCDRLDYCRGGCRGVAYALTQNLWQSDDTCRKGGEQHGSASRQVPERALRVLR